MNFLLHRRPDEKTGSKPPELRLHCSTLLDAINELLANANKAKNVNSSKPFIFARYHGSNLPAKTMISANQTLCYNIMRILDHYRYAHRSSYQLSTKQKDMALGMCCNSIRLALYIIL